MRYIYHLVDTTAVEFEGSYYHVGMFGSFLHALEWLRDLEEPYSAVEVEDEQHFEVRKYEIGVAEWSGQGDVVAKAPLREKQMPEDYKGADVWEMEIKEKGVDYD